LSKDINNYDCYVDKSTLVLTLHRGYIKIEDITQDDFVLTHTGKWSKVIEVVMGKNVPVKKIRTFKSPELYASDKQMFYTSNRKERVWTPLSKINYDTSLCSVIPKDKVSVVTQDTFWRFIGVWLKRGYFKNNGSFIAVQVNKVEEKFLTEVLEGVGVEYNKVKLSTNTEFLIKDSDLRLVSSDFIDSADEKVIPGFILNEDTDKVKLMLEVFLDLVNFSRKKIRHIPIYNEGMAYMVSLLIQKCYNIPTSVNKTKLIGLDNKTKLTYIITNKFNGRRSLSGIYDWTKPKHIDEEIIITTGYSLVVNKYNSYIANNTLVRGILKK